MWLMDVYSEDMFWTIVMQGSHEPVFFYFLIFWKPEISEHEQMIHYLKLNGEAEFEWVSFIVWSYCAAGSKDYMILCINMVFQPILSTIIFKLTTI